MPKKYPPNVEALLNVAAFATFSEKDFADLCLAAADQAGVSVKNQKKIAALLPASAGVES